MADRRTVVYDAEAGDDHERQGTVWTATSHIVAAVVGSGVLALAWTVAQLGWVVGPLVLVGFSCVTYYTSALLADCYRYPDPVDGAVNREYMDAVRCYLGTPEERGAVRVRAVREPVGHSRRLHHHRQRQHDRGEARQLLPPRRLRRGGVQPIREHVHGGVRPLPAPALAAPEPPQHRLALRGRRGHLLRLLLHQPGPLRLQVGVPRRRERHPRHAGGRRRRRSPGEGLQRAPRAGQHRLLVHVRRRAHRDPGHAAVAAGRERHHEEGVLLRARHDHRLLPRARVYRVRRVRGRRAGEYPDGVRVLRAVLARRRRQRLRHRAPHRGVPGVRAAHLCQARVLRLVPMARRQVHQRHLLRPCPAVPPVFHFLLAAGHRGRGTAQARTAHHRHHVHDAGGDAAAILQRRAGAHRRARVLAALRLLPRQHAHGQAQDPARRAPVVVAAGYELRLPPHLHRRQHRLRAGHRAQPQDRRAIQDRKLIDY